MYKECETCAYYDTDKHDQPCCGCVDGVNHEKRIEDITATIEFVKKSLRAAKVNLEHAKERVNVRSCEITMLQEKIKHYELVLRVLAKESVNDD